MKYTTTVALILAGVEANYSFGGCPTVEWVDNFQPDRYLGKWYETKRGYFNIMELGTDCVTAEFKKNKDGKNVDLNFRGYYHWMFSYASGAGTLWDCADGSKDTWTCKATMGGSDNKSPLSVLATDYDNYEVAYFCKDFAWGAWKYEDIAVRSRKYALTDAQNKEVEAVVAKKLPDMDLNGWLITETK